MIDRTWELFSYAVQDIETSSRIPEADALEQLKAWVVDRKVQARGRWPKGPGVASSTDPVCILPHDEFRFVERIGDKLTFLQAMKAVNRVEINVVQLRRALAGEAAEAAPASSGGRKRHGRPPDTSMAKADAPYLKTMRKFVEKGLTPTKAAWKVVRQDGSGVPGNADPESKVRRLVGRLKNGE